MRGVPDFSSFGGGFGVSRNAVDRTGSERADSSTMDVLHIAANLLSTLEGAGFFGRIGGTVSFPVLCCDGSEFESLRTLRDESR